MRSLAPLREAGRLRALGQALESESDLASTQVARSFPPQRKLKGSLADLLGSYETRLNPKEPEMWFFARNDTPVGDGDLYLADARHLELDMPHAVNAGFKDTDWFHSPEQLRKLAAYLTRVADAASAFYAYCASSHILDQRLKLLESNAVLGHLFKGGRAVPDLHRELPDVYWWNYFGPAFVKKWGGKLDGLGVRNESTPAGARVVWATETPFVLDRSVRRLAGYPWKEPFYAALGNDTFMREGQKPRSTGEAVPDFNAHRIAAGSPAVSADTTAPAQAKFLPRIVRIGDQAPEDAEFEDARAELIEEEGFELHLTGDKDLPVDEVMRWLKNRSDTAVIDSNSAGLIVYRNPDTGVVAGFEVERRDLRVRVPWLRPMFFGREAMSLVVDLGQKLDLRLPSSASTVQQLVELWERGNVDAVRRSHQPLPYMSRQRSDRWWLYQSRKDDLHRRLGEAVFVPTLVAVAPRSRTEDLRLHITWADATPLLLPGCDLVTLLEGRRPSEFKIRGTAAYEDVRKALEPYLEPMSVEGLGTLSLLTPKRAKEARAVFLELPTRAFDHVEVSPARWVDVTPDR